MASKVRNQIRAVMPTGASDVQIDPGMVKGQKGSKTFGTRKPFKPTYTPKGVKVSGRVKVKKSKKAADFGRDKGQLHLVNGAVKTRRFTPDQRQAFRTKRKPFGGPGDGRPTA